MTDRAKHVDQSIKEKGQLCPFCGATEFESEIEDWEEPEMVEVNVCGACQKTWRVGYAIRFAWLETE